MKKHRAGSRFHRKSILLGATVVLMTAPLLTAIPAHNVYDVSEIEGVRTVNTNLTDDDGSILQKFGGGTLLLTGSSTYSGGTEIYGGTLTLSGSNAFISHSTSDFSIEQGSLQIVNGGFAESNNGSLGTIHESIASASVSGTGSQWNIYDVLRVGYEGTGSLSISAGGYVFTRDDGRIGDNLGSTGHVVVTGSGSEWEIGEDLHVGDEGTASLTISAGGYVNTVEDGYIANEVGSTGQVVVTGSGSKLEIGWDLYVGNGGMGSLTISEAGSVSSSRGYIGREEESTGQVVVTGSGSQWSIDDELIVGDYGTGSLTISNGGYVYTDDDGAVGNENGSSGQVVVTGSGSQWSIDDGLTVGNYGTGSLTISNGGYVRNDWEAFIGWGEGGTGSVLVTGAGSLWESGANLSIGTYGEGSLTISNGGVVRVESMMIGFDSEPSLGGVVYLGGEGGVGTLNIGSAPGEAATGAGYLDAGAVVGTSGSGQGFAPASNGTINFNHTSKDYTFTPQIFGSITVNHFSGETTLVGAHEYYGGTNVYGGSLLVDGSIAGRVEVVGGLLGGNGFIYGDVYNQSFVSPGHSIGTLVIDGNYIQTGSGAYFVEINKHDHDYLFVWGDAELNGSLLLAYRGGFTPKVNKSYTILSTGEGVIEGEFSNIKNLTPTMLKPKVSYDSYDVTLSFEQGKFSDVSGLTPNQKAVAKGLDSILNKRGARKLIDKLNTLPLGDIPDTLSLLSPEQFAAIFNIGFATSQIQFGNIERRLEDARNGASGFSTNGLALSNSRGSLNYNGMPLSNEKDGLTLAGWVGKSIVGKQTVAPIISESRWSFFATGTGEWADVETTGNARGSEFTTGGVTVGADYRVNRNLVVGLTAGYTNTDSDLNNGGKIDLNSGRAGVYATVYNDGLYLNALVGGAYNSYDTKRSTLGGKANGSTHGGEFDALLGGGYDICTGGFTFGPVASLRYTYIGLDSFTENGSDAPLHFKSQNQDSLKSTLGLKASYAFNVGGIVITPEVRAQWLHEYLDSTAAVESSFAAGGSTFTTRGPNLGRDGLLLDAGVTAQFNPNFAVFAYYTGDIGRSNYNSNSVNGGFRISF